MWDSCKYPNPLGKKTGPIFLALISIIGRGKIFRKVDSVVKSELLLKDHGKHNFLFLMEYEWAFANLV